jgi:glutaredoxin
MMSDLDASHGSETPEVVMYCRTWCGDCARARRWLDAHNIPYTEIDVEADPNARERAAGHNDGQLHTPTFEIGDGVCVDFRPDKLSKLLGIE